MGSDRSSTASKVGERLRWAGTVRVRTTLAATLVVAVALTMGAWALLHLFQSSLENDRKTAAISRAADIASLAAAGHLPPVLGLPDEDTTLAQVVAGGGRVLAASANIAGEPAVGPLLTQRSDPIVHTVHRIPTGEAGRFGLVATPARADGQPITVYTVYSYQTSDLAVRDATVGLLVGLPILLLVVAATTWIIVGRAFRPIQAIRTEVSEITTHGLDRRVPEPATADEVARLARTMNSMLDRLETSVGRQRAFVADASHELRSPLASLRTQLEIGLAQGAATDWRAVVSDALVDEARIEQLVADLLILAWLDNDPRLSGADTVDLAEIIRAEVERRPGRAGLTLRSDVTGPTMVRLSGDLTCRVITNLLDNAQRHARADVLVSTDQPDPAMVRVTVTDDGPGVAPADRERVFERFTRLDNSRTGEDGGAGLGLAIVRDIVTRVGGRVAFADTVRGAQVVVSLPVAAVPPPPTPSRPPGQPHAPLPLARRVTPPPTQFGGRI